MTPTRLSFRAAMRIYVQPDELEGDPPYLHLEMLSRIEEDLQKLGYTIELPQSFCVVDIITELEPLYSSSSKGLFERRSEIARLFLGWLKLSLCATCGRIYQEDAKSCPVCVEKKG